MYECVVVRIILYILYAKFCRAFDVRLFIIQMKKKKEKKAKLGLDIAFTIRRSCVSAQTVGGADGSIGEDTPGAGHHQAASVLHSAVATREGSAPEQPPSGQTQAAPGDSGDEVSHTNASILQTHL